MHIQRRLAFLRLMLRDYNKKIYLTDNGFCYYLSHHPLINNESLNLVLEDLRLQRIKERQNYVRPSGFWYDTNGATPERIKTIESTIDTLEDRIESGVLFYEDLKEDSKKISRANYFKNHQEFDYYKMKRDYVFDLDGNLKWKG